MKKTLLLLTSVLALATAVALAQTTSSGGSAQTPSNGPAWGTPSQTAPASQDPGKHDKNKSPVDDSTLTTQIQQQIASDPALKNVQVTVSNGVVNLDGTVASKADKKHAKQVVAAIPGVRKVHDRLTVNANATATPGNNEPANASAGTTGTTGTSTASTTATSSNTAGSIAGNSGTSSTTPQTPTTSSKATAGSSTAGSGMPQSDVNAGANAGVGATGSQTGASAGVGTTGTQAGANAGVGATGSQTGASAGVGTTGTQAGASAGVGTTGTQAGANAGTGASSAQTGAGVSGSPSSSIPQSSTGSTGAIGSTGATGTTDATGAAGTTGATGATTGNAGAISSDLQTQIRTALRHEPTLANDHINATVSGDTIDLTGTVASGKDRQTALRIAQSFAGNRRVSDHMTVAGQGAGSTTGTQPDMGTSGASNPSATPSNPSAAPGSTNNPR